MSLRLGSRECIFSPKHLVFTKFYTELPKEPKKIRRLLHHLSHTAPFPSMGSGNESKDSALSKQHIS